MIKSFLPRSVFATESSDLGNDACSLQVVHPGLEEASYRDHPSQKSAAEVSDLGYDASSLQVVRPGLEEASYRDHPFQKSVAEVSDLGNDASSLHVVRSGLEEASYRDHSHQKSVAEVSDLGIARLRTLCFSFFLGFLFATGGTAEDLDSQPNIVFIFADDLSWADLACYGRERFSTPHLDQLASEGIRFTEAYAAAPICSASRAAVLTGNSTARNRFEFVVKKEPGRQEFSVPLRTPPFVLNLPLAARTIPEILSTSGYQSAFFGKWHLNAHHERYLGWSSTHGPLGQGFGTAIEDFGSHPYSYWNKKEKRTFDDTLEDGTFPEDGMTQRAIRFLSEDHDDPFFLMVSHFFVHDPNHTRLRWLHDQYLEQLPEDTQNRENVAHYGAMVTTLDHHVGKLLAALEESGKRDSTLVVFTSDNGGHPNYAGNAPLRGSKWNLYEGGIRVPLLIRWPGVTPQGAVCNAPVWSPDLAPTFAEVAGTDGPTAHDGRSLLPLLKKPDTSPEDRSFFWHFPYYHPEKQFDERIAAIGIDDGETSKTRPHSAIRTGGWKLIHFYEDEHDELYHLDEDLAEQNDLATAAPERTAAMRKTLLEYLKAVDARLPEPNPDFRP